MTLVEFNHVGTILLAVALSGGISGVVSQWLAPRFGLAEFRSFSVAATVIYCGFLSIVIWFGAVVVWLFTLGGSLPGLPIAYVAVAAPLSLLSGQLAASVAPPTTGDGRSWRRLSSATGLLVLPLISVTAIWLILVTG